MIDLNKKFQHRIADSMEFVSRHSDVAGYSRVSDADLQTVEERGIQAGILTQFKKRVMDSEEGRAFITSNNYGPYLPELWPIITAWYPEFPLKELISVQDMEQDLAYIITSELLTATNKADTTKGEKVETPAGPRTIHGRYPTGEIFGEELVAADFSYTEESSVVVSSEAALAYYPILNDDESLLATKIVATKSDDTTVEDFKYVNTSDGKMNFASHATPAQTATIELATGIISIKGNFKAATVSYVWNIEYATDENIPSVVEDMKMVPLIAKPRVLAMKWTIFSEYVKKKQFGIDIRTQTTKRVLDLLYQYQVRYILDRMYNGAKGTPVTLTIPTTILDLNLKVQKVLEDLNVFSQTIQTNTGRIEGNCLVVGNNLKAFFESLPDTYYKKWQSNSDYGFNGPRKIGTIGRYTVFYDDKLANNKAWMTYRGAQWYDAAFYLGMFMPVAPTEAINVNIDVRQAFVEMCAYRYDKPMAVIPITVA